jgi:tripartite-type tricarboxylate transporter receptor subunit TctC
MFSLIQLGALSIVRTLLLDRSLDRYATTVRRGLDDMMRTIAIAVVASCAAFGAAHAQQFPSRAVHLLVPFAPGGGVDSLVRALSEPLTKKWGQPVVIENKPGANTMIAGEAVVRAPADGHTLLVTSDSSITSNPLLFKKLPFNPVTALSPVTQLVDMYQMVLVHPSLPVNSIQDLVTLAKQANVRLNYGSYGNGSPPHLLFESLKTKTSIDLTQVPFRGAAPAVVATLSNDIQLTLGGAATAGEFVVAGRLRAIATGRKERLSTFPNVQTLAEAGYATLDPKTWFGVFAPAGTPVDLVTKISKDIADIVNDPVFRSNYVDAFGYTAAGSTPQEFSAFIKEDMDYKRELISLARIRPE